MVLSFLVIAFLALTLLALIAERLAAQRRFVQVRNQRDAAQDAHSTLSHTFSVMLANFRNSRFDSSTINPTSDPAPQKAL